LGQNKSKKRFTDEELDRVEEAAESLLDDAEADQAARPILDLLQQLSNKGHLTPAVRSVVAALLIDCCKQSAVSGGMVKRPDAASFHLQRNGL
jgi:uncharacterized protein HemY